MLDAKHLIRPLTTMNPLQSIQGTRIACCMCVPVPYERRPLPTQELEQGDITRHEIGPRIAEAFPLRCLNAGVLGAASPSLLPSPKPRTTRLLLVICDYVLNILPDIREVC